MSRMLFDVRDVANIRFCVSPIWETVRSRYALGFAERYPMHQPWLRAVRQARTDPGLARPLDLLAELTRPLAYFPDFLTPPPAGPVGEFEQQLATVAGTPAEVVVADLAATTAQLPLGPLTARALDDPERLRDLLVDGVREWHRVAIAPYWTRIRTVLAADIAYRSRQLAEGGARRLFDTLHERVRWAGDHIESDDGFDHELDLRGRGLPLTPSVFVKSYVLWSLRADSAPGAVYPARAVASLWERRPAAGGALAALFGGSRAHLLQLLRQPATTSELAVRLNVSVATVSEHLRVMHAAGLLARSRHGREVRYVATAAGHTLLTAGGQAD